MDPITASRGLSIGALSRLTGVHIETIRYYERIHLLRRPSRTQGGHRSYDAEQVTCLRFIRQARSLGFGLEAIRSLLALSERGANSCAKAREIAAERLADVRAKLSDLAQMESVLAETIASCDQRCCSTVAPACPVLEILTG